MKIRRPEFSEILRMIAVAVISDSGNIVGEGIQPDINNMSFIKVYRNSPFKREILTLKYFIASVDKYSTK